MKRLFKLPLICLLLFFAGLFYWIYNVNTLSNMNEIKQDMRETISHSCEIKVAKDYKGERYIFYKDGLNYGIIIYERNILGDHNFARLGTPNSFYYFDGFILNEVIHFSLGVKNFDKSISYMTFSRNSYSFTEEIDTDTTLILKRIDMRNDPYLPPYEIKFFDKNHNDITESLEEKYKAIKSSSK